MNPADIAVPDPGHELEPSGLCLTDLSLGDRPHDDDACVSKRRPEVKSFRQRRDTERRSPSVERSTRDVDRAVTVPLRLDDRPQLGTAGSAQQRFGVSPDRPEIDGETRALHY